MNDLSVGDRVEYLDSYKAQLFGKMRVVEVLSSVRVNVREESGDNRIWKERAADLKILARKDIPYHP